MNTPKYPEAFSFKAIGLGAPKRYFPVKGLYRIGSLVAFFIFIGSSILVFMYGFFVTYAAFQKHGPALIDDQLAAPLIIAFMLALLGLAAGIAAYENWNKGVAVYDQGFALRTRKGIHIWRWAEIVSLTTAVTRYHVAGIFIGTTHGYSLIDYRYQRIRINDIYTNVEELAKAIQDGIFPILYDRAAQQYNAGQKLVCGPVAISTAGIQVGKKTYPWAEVQQVSIRQGILRVSKDGGGWFSGASASASVIPNLNILLNIIHQVVGLKVD